MKIFRKFYLRLLICTGILLLLLPVTEIKAKADCGPKPRVEISFSGLGETECYATLLSEYRSTGPQMAWDGTEENAYYKEAGFDNALEYSIWRAFVDYEDADGYYFLQIGWKVSNNRYLNWSYYPPQKFKILLYFPETQDFIASGIYERYAFESYFKVDVFGMDTEESAVGRIEVEKSYDYTWEAISLVARIIFTILVELGIALIFRYRAPKQIKFIIWVNVATQVILNVLLNIIDYFQGFLVFMIFYVLLEFLIFIAEAVLYTIFLPKYDERNRERFIAFIYSFVANLCSFLLGFGLSLLIIIPV